MDSVSIFYSQYAWMEPKPLWFSCGLWRDGSRYPPSIISLLFYFPSNNHSKTSAQVRRIPFRSANILKLKKSSLLLTVPPLSQLITTVGISSTASSLRMCCAIVPQRGGAKWEGPEDEYAFQSVRGKLLSPKWLIYCLLSAHCALVLGHYSSRRKTQEQI